MLVDLSSMTISLVDSSAIRLESSSIPADILD
jgi:hypothetical protein